MTHWPALLPLILVVAGCGPDGPKTYPVSGVVTWQGQPVPDGHVVFVPSDEKQTPEAGKIVQGEFSLQAQAGVKRVEIQASREARGGQVDPAMGAVPREEYIPAEYSSTQSKLSAEVKSDGPNRFEFHLPLKP